MPPNQHTPEEIRDMEHWQRQSIASDYEVTPNLSKEELKTQLIDAVEHPPNPDVVEYSPEEIREMEYHEWQSIAPEYDVHPNLSPCELEERLIDAVTESEPETDNADPGHDNDNARNDQSTTPIEDTEQAALTDWGARRSITQSSILSSATTTPMHESNSPNRIGSTHPSTARVILSTKVMRARAGTATGRSA